MRATAVSLFALLAAGPAFAQNQINGSPISQLPPATVPLTGTEVMPIVQGGTTKQVPVNQTGSGIFGFTPPYTVNIVDYCNVSQIASDITICGQNAINAAQALAGGSYGGAIVYFPARNSPYNLVAGTLKVTSSFVTLKGDGKQASYINCANGAADCVQIGQATGSQIRDDRVVDLGILGNGAKTAGAGIHVQNVYRMLTQNVDLENMIRGFDNDATVSNTNDVTLDNVTIVANQTASDYGIYWHADGTGTYRSDQFTLNKVSVNGAWTSTNLVDIGWDGFANSLNMSNVVTVIGKYGLRITNNAASSLYFPQFMNADNIQIQDVTARAVDIEAGAYFKITNSDLDNSHGATSQGNADDYAVAILPDTSHSATRGVQISNSQIGLSGKSAIYVGGVDTELTAIQIVGAGQTTPGTYAGIEMAATASRLHAVAINGELLGGPVDAAYVVQLDSGSTGFVGDGIDGTYVTVRAVNDLGGIQANYRNIIEPISFTGTSTEGWANSSSQADQMIRQIRNLATGANVQAGNKFVTGTANSFCSEILADQTGSPVFTVSCASGVTNGIYYASPDKHQRLQLLDQGTCTMATGTCSAQALASTYGAAPICQLTWTGTGTLTGVLKVAASTTTVTPSSSVGSDTAVVNWACFGN